MMRPHKDKRRKRDGRILLLNPYEIHYARARNIFFFSSFSSFVSLSRLDAYNYMFDGSHEYFTPLSSLLRRIRISMLGFCFLILTHSLVLINNVCFECCFRCVVVLFSFLSFSMPSFYTHAAAAVARLIICYCVDVFYF